MSVKIQVFTVLTLAQICPHMSQFVFELEVDLHSVMANIDCDLPSSLDGSQCETYFSVFCLREGREGSQSTNTEDCPLGRNTERMNAYRSASELTGTRIKDYITKTMASKNLKKKNIDK